MTSRPLVRRVGITSVVLGLLALLPGCFAAEMALTIREDDADIAYSLLVDVEQLAELAGMVGTDVPDLSALSGEALIDQILEGEDPCADMRTAFPDREVTTAEVSQGGRRGVQCTVTGVPLAELNQLGEDTNVAVDRDGSTTTVSIDLAGVDDLTAEGDQMGNELGLAFQDLYEIRFVVTALGTLGEHNATSVEGATATWLITPTADFIDNGTASLRATWTGGGDGGGGGTIALVVIAVVVLLGVVGVIVVVTRRRSGPRSGSPLPPPPPPPPPSTPPYVGGAA